MAEAIAAAAPTEQQPTLPVAAAPIAAEQGTAPVVADQQAAPSTALTDTAKAADAEKPATEPDKPAAKSPEQYADFTLPDGYTLDGKVGAEFKTLAKEMDLTQEQAQKLIDLDARRAQEQLGMVHAQSAVWAEQSKGDKEIGGDRLAENVAVAQKALTAFGTPELKMLLQQTGLGNNPEIIRAFYRAGKSISEDTMVTSGSGSSKGARDSASALYPSLSTH